MLDDQIILCLCTQNLLSFFLGPQLGLYFIFSFIKVIVSDDGFHFSESLWFWFWFLLVITFDGFIS